MYENIRRSQTLLMKLPFFSANFPHSRKTTPSRLRSIHLMVASVNLSQPYGNIYCDSLDYCRGNIIFMLYERR